jgi:hypothetical protein
MASKRPSYLPKFELTEFGKSLLAEIRNSLAAHRLYGKDPAEADRLVAAIVEPAVAGAVMGAGMKLQYRWFLREMVRVFRTRSGPELAMQVELVLAKWFAFGLKVELMQWLLSAVWNRVRAEGAAG